MSADHAAVNMSKREALYTLLADGAWHNHHELAMAGGVRYSARVLELKRIGYVIESEDTSGGEQGKRYRLASTTPGECQPKRVKVLLKESDVIAMVERGFIPNAARTALRDAHASFDTNRDKL